MAAIPNQMKWADMVDEEEEEQAQQRSSQQVSTPKSTAIEAPPVAAASSPNIRSLPQPRYSPPFQAVGRSKRPARSQAAAATRTSAVSSWRLDTTPSVADTRRRTHDLFVFHRDYKNSDLAIKDQIRGSGEQDIRQYGERKGLHVFHVYCPETQALWNNRWGEVQRVCLGSSQLQSFTQACASYTTSSSR